MGKNRRRDCSSSDDSDYGSLKKRLERLERILIQSHSVEYGSNRSRSRKLKSDDEYRHRRDSKYGDRGYLHDRSYYGERVENLTDRPSDENCADNGQQHVREMVSPQGYEDSHDDDLLDDDASTVKSVCVDNHTQQPENMASTAALGLATADAEGVSSEVRLESEVLQVMGDRLKPDRIMAPAIHKDLAIRFEEVVNTGLPTEERKSLLKKFPSAENCLFMDPPKLNLEIKASLQEAIIKRDSRIVEKQERLTACLAGLTNLTSTVLQFTTQDKLPMLEVIGGVMRLLCDLQHEESSIRRSLILKNIDASMRETLKSVGADEFLFGKNLEEKVKAVKTLEVSSNRLKPKSQSGQFNELKNLKGPPRRQIYKPRTYVTSGGQKPSSSNQKYNQKYNRGRKPQPKQNHSSQNAKKDN